MGLEKHVYSDRRCVVGVVYDMMPTGGIKIITDFGMIVHSKSKREYWIKQAHYQMKCNLNMGMTSIPVSRILEMYQLHRQDIQPTV